MQRYGEVEVDSGFGQGAGGGPGRLGVVDVGGPVQRDHAVALGQSVCGAHGGRIKAVQVAEQGVDHRIADEVDTVRVDAFPAEVTDGLRAGGEQQLGELVDQAPV